MTSRIVTVTSKNQITLPAELVRKYKLDKNRRLSITEKKGALELRPQPSLEERMRPHWEAFRKSHPNHKPLTDEELKRAIRDSFVTRWQELEKEGRV